MKFGQSIEYNTKIFLEKSFTKCEREDIPRLYKKSKLSLSLDQQYKCYTDCFHCMSKSRSTEIYQTVFVRYQKVRTKNLRMKKAFDIK